MPAALLEITIQAVATGAVPAGVAALTKEVLTSMFITKLKRVAVLLAAGVFGTAAVALAFPEPVEERAPEKKVPQARAARVADATTEEKEALQGAWEGQAAEHDGEALADDDVKKIRVSIKGDRLLMTPGRERTPVAFKIDPAKSPKVLNMAATEGTDKGKVVPFIYRLDKEADTLTLCWDAKDGKAVPEDFAAKKGSGFMLLVLKHEPRPPATAK